MEMTGKELIEKLKEFNQDAKIITITVGSNNNAEYLYYNDIVEDQSEKEQV